MNLAFSIPYVRIASFAVLLVIVLAQLAPAAPRDARGVTLLLQGAGPVISSRAGDETWGEYLPDADGRLRWTGFVGHLVQRHGWKMGGVLRPQAEQVLHEHLDPLGSVPADQADLYILASSLPSQQDGIDSRARELASAVAMLRSRTGAQQVRLVAYSAAGVAARLWLQGGLANQPYQPGSVDRLICVASPHLGIGTAVRPVAVLSPRYAALAPGSPTLVRINRDLDLPSDVRFVDVLVQGAKTSLTDFGRAYLPDLRLPESQADRLPPLLREGHDGVVHALSAQLHLTPAAARYENRTGRPVEIVVCLPGEIQSGDMRDLTLHTMALRDPVVWQTLRELLEQPAAEEDAARRRETWARQIVQHQAATAVQRRYPTGRIETLWIVRCEIAAPDADRLRCVWQARGQLTVPRLLRSPQSRTCEATGAFTLDFDRFHRPTRWHDSAVEVEER
jgi:hypothetical protein